MMKKHSTGKFRLFVSITMAAFVSVVSCNKNLSRRGPAVDATGPALATGNALSFADAAQFNTPFAVAVDVSGNVYVADAANHSIRKMTPQGVVSTLAGNGTAGLVNGPGAAAEFNFPTSLVVDRSKNVYVADANNNCIRMIDASGNVTTLAGDTVLGFSDGTGTAARFATPEGIALDGNGNLYVTDTYNHAIRKITRTGVVSTVAGGTPGYQEGTGKAARFLFPNALVSDPHGNLFVADRGNNRVRRVNSAGATSSLAGDGNSNTLGSIGGITMDPGGNVFVTDEYNNRIRRIDPQGTITLFAGSGAIGLLDGPAAFAQFYYPLGLAADAFGAIYVADTYNHRIVQIPTDGLAYVMAGNGKSGFADGPGVAVEYNSPFGVCRDAAGNTYVADANNRRIRKINPNGLVCTLAGSDTARGLPFRSTLGIVADGQGNVYVADQQNNTIDIVSPTGAVRIFAGTGFNASGSADGQGLAAQFNGPTGLAIDGQGNLFVADENNSKIRKITTPAAVVSTIAGDGNFGFQDGPGAAAEFRGPWSVAVDSIGNCYVADSYNQRIRKIDPAGNVSTLDGDGFINELDYPTGVAVDAAGNVLVTDFFHYRIRKISPAGIVSTLAGDGNKGFKDATGIAAEFDDPAGIAVDAKGNIYVADEGNNRIRKITAAGVVTNFSGNGIPGK